MADTILHEPEVRREAARSTKKMDVRKISFNLPESSYRAVDEFAKSRGVSMTEVFRRAIASELFLQNEAAKGMHIIIEDDSGEVRKELLMNI